MTCSSSTPSCAPTSEARRLLRLNILTTQRATPLSGRPYRKVVDMHTIHTLPQNEARAELLQEYIAYIQRLARGQAGKLEPEEGKTTQAVRCGLNAAAE